MPRALLLWCTTIVAAFPLRLAAAPPPVARVPVTPPVAALASRLEMDLVRDRARFVPEIIRRIYSPPPSRQVPLNLTVDARAPVDAGAPVDIPLLPDMWSQSVFHRPVTPDRLLAAILGDRRAALLCRGLAAADDETLEFYSAHPALLAFIYERAAPAFAAFASSLRVHDGRIVVPGGAPAIALWEPVTHASVDNPDAFVRALLFEPEARLGYLYDVLATASAPARAFALGLWIDDESLRVRRFQALALAVRSSFREWHVDELPFARPMSDLSMLLLRIRVDEHGTPQPPADRRFWSAAVDAAPTPEPPGEATPASHTLVDAAWLLGATAGDMYVRGDRLDQFAFGQRVFGSDPDGQSDRAAAVIREMPTRRMLLLGLERLGVTDPELYAAGLRQARATLEGGGERFWSVTQQQAAIALVSRMAWSDGIRASDAESLLRTLFVVPVSGGEFHGELARWMESALASRMPSGPTWQARVIAALAGGPTPGSPRVEWEGQTYRLDLAFAERRRIEDIVSRQGGPGVDLALRIEDLGRRAQQATGPDALTALVAEAQSLLADSGAALVRAPGMVMAAGVPVPRDGREWLARSADELDRAARTSDMRRASRAADSLVSLGDMALGQALLSLVYAVHLGDPQGPALLGANVALRHDFGFGRRDGDGRARGAWAQPRQDFQPGVPWHVVGSLVGLDVALAPLTLHRLSMDGLAVPPRVPSIEREAFAVNVALLNPRRLTDLDRDRIVDGIARGRARVKALTASGAGLDQVVDALGLDGWRERAIRWTLENDPAAATDQFSQAELLVLGGRTGPDAWGTSAIVPLGCVCTRFPEPRTWRIIGGRAQLPTLAASTVEMNLEMASRLAALRLPAALLPSLLATAMQDFVDQAGPADPGDRPALLTYPPTIGRNTVADYVAATATLQGPLVLPDAEDASTP